VEKGRQVERTAQGIILHKEGMKGTSMGHRKKKKKDFLITSGTWLNASTCFISVWNRFKRGEEKTKKRGIEEIR